MRAQVAYRARGVGIDVVLLARYQQQRELGTVLWCYFQWFGSRLGGYGRRAGHATFDGCEEVTMATTNHISQWIPYTLTFSAKPPD